MRDKSIKELIVALCVAVIFIILGPALSYFGGWVFGWVTHWTIGSWFVPTVNSILGTSITMEMLPQLGGILGVIGYFFRGGNFKSE